MFVAEGRQKQSMKAQFAYNLMQVDRNDKNIHLSLRVLHWDKGHELKSQKLISERMAQELKWKQSNFL